jgi:hypothetical protein
MPLTASDIKFVNEKIRPAADRLAQSYSFAKTVTAEWTARGGTTAIPNDATVVADGAATDGRPVIINSDVSSIINRLSEFITDYEAASSAKLNTVLKVAVNTR